MKVREQRRHEAIERMADYLLAEGLGAATLRPLATAAGTSDRMLLYYFADREEVLTTTLHRVVERMVVQLDAAIPSGKVHPFTELLLKVRAVLSQDDLKPFMHIWLDLTSGAARKSQPHLKMAGAIADGFGAWLASRLKVEDGSDPAISTALLVAFASGLLVMEAIERSPVADQAAAGLIAHMADYSVIRSV